MAAANVAQEEQPPVDDSSAYGRFIVLSDARTGSHMLAQALNSSPRIICFREVFNGLLDFIQYSVEGYDDFSSRDMALREEDPVRFLRERIFCQQPDEIRAVGFKYHYGHTWGFPGVLDSLVKDTEIRLLHLRRRNLLRTLVSLKLAHETEIWLQDGASKLTQTNVQKALRHPLKAVGRLGRLLRARTSVGAGPQVRVTVSADECWTFFTRMQSSAAHFEYIFRGHPRLTVIYEDLLQRRDEVFDQAQAFLGVEPGPLTVTLRRQNPEPLEELVENHEELYEAFRGTPYEVFFD